jgi:hypothetical protein
MSMQEWPSGDGEGAHPDGAAASAPPRGGDDALLLNLHHPQQTGILAPVCSLANHHRNLESKNSASYAQISQRINDPIRPGLIPTKYEQKKCMHSISGRRGFWLPASGEMLWRHVQQQ